MDHHSGSVDTIMSIDANDQAPEYVKLYDDHTQPHEHATSLQIALLVLWLVGILMWLFKPKSMKFQTETEQKEVPKAGDVKSKDVKVEIGEGSKKEVETTFSKFKPPPALHEVLKHIALMGAIMYFFYLCDYVKVILGIFSQLSKHLCYAIFNLITSLLCINIFIEFIISIFTFKS